MPVDITMCPGGDCPRRQGCYRHRAVAEGRQDWFGAPPFDRATGACDQFWDLARLQPTEDDVRTRAYHRWLAAGRPEGDPDVHWHAARAELEAAAAARVV